MAMGNSVARLTSLDQESSEIEAWSASESHENLLARSVNSLIGCSDDGHWEWLGHSGAVTVLRQHFHAEPSENIEKLMEQKLSSDLQSNYT